MVKNKNLNQDRFGGLFFMGGAMDMQAVRFVIEMLVTAFAGVLWYLIRKVIADLKEIEKILSQQAKDFSEYKLHVSEKFVHYDTFKRIEDKIDKIFEKLDQKADKV